MAYLPVDGSVLYTVSNVVPFTKQGTAFNVGGGFVTVSGQPSQQLLPSTNIYLGYFPGNMLATASGVKADTTPSGLTAGAMINWDVASLDTGQKVWNKFIIIDQTLKFPLPLSTTYAGALQCATAYQGWVIRQGFLYGGGTPAVLGLGSSDATVVQTAVTTAGVIQSQSGTSSSGESSEIVFSY